MTRSPVADQMFCAIKQERYMGCLVISLLYIFFSLKRKIVLNRRLKD